MSVIAKHYISMRDKQGKLTQYKKGDIISTLSEEEEDELIECGAAESYGMYQYNANTDRSGMGESAKHVSQEKESGAGQVHHVGAEEHVLKEEEHAAGQTHEDGEGSDAQNRQEGAVSIRFNAEEYVGAASGKKPGKK